MVAAIETGIQLTVFLFKLVHLTQSHVAPGQTTVGHRKLAILHDSLERKLLSSLLSESLEHGFTFSVKRPVGDNINLQCSGCDHFSPGAMAHKRHVLRYLEAGKLHCGTVDHCNYTPADILSYAKATDYINNLDWHPIGDRGDGHCGHTGCCTGVKCNHGWQNEMTGHWKHYNTIAQESHNKISGDGYHCKASKNHLPFTECTKF